MAKYEITRACGHTETVQIVGPYAGRDRQAEYESGNLCYECYKARQAEKHAAESNAAAEAAQSSGLPALSGSEKQIAWAETIRATAAQSLGALRPMIAAAPEAHRKTADIALGIIDATLARTSAHDWIESRAIRYDRDWLSSQTKKAMEA
jgi:hypothetical protein